MKKLILKAHESVHFAGDLSDKDIRNIVKNETGLSVRRLDRFTLIALNAVDRLIKRNETSKHLALYSAAEYMSIELFQSVIFALENNEAIRPYDFIATVGNAANFYISKEYKINGPNVFIGASENILLKTALLAETDIELGHCQQAVIVIWQINNKERSCHALLVEQIEDNSKEITNEWHSTLNSCNDLLELTADTKLPMLLNLNYN
ncbi:hypothetical protein [Colwellia sp. E2M01]|uniref:hypothetical protein n=1 Tax=Colwellia sp. E2M01 TaxID=2841561 RepID=UPI001C0834EF|nr:hypothetical protein [Colwellia sp. E2M01]MBU2871610.1 hypothetical protein [Colwellia sp. E2M01]